MSELDASKMLEAALQQMDGIISGASSSGSPHATHTEKKSQVPAIAVLSAAYSLSLALQHAGHNTPLPERDVAKSISSWLDACYPKPETDERIIQLQKDKETLSLQVESLSRQASEQNEKIVKLERSLTDKTQLLNNTEDMLQREILARSSLETQRLELVSAMSELKLQQAALERENFELRSSQFNNNNVTSRRPPPASSPYQNHHAQLGSSTLHGSFSSLQQQPSNNTSTSAPKTPPASFRHQVNPHFSSLPRSKFISSGNGGSSATKSPSLVVDNNANPKHRNVGFAEFEKILDAQNSMTKSYTQSMTSSPAPKARGLKGIFGKMRRSNSGNLEDLTGDSDLKRGGLRATAGPRLGRYEPNKKCFKEWGADEICAWFCDMGLNSYEDDIRKCVKIAPEENVSLLQDIEKDLSFKNPLHKKKVTLALDELYGRETDELAINAGKLDTTWILRWLDDIGLPQYKDSFIEARVDGRMLHKLTLEDLAFLHVTSCLHIVSIRRGIQVMRENKWFHACLIRRSDSEYNADKDVSLWTAHRVMEWLRVIDLAEYAPNLRGAGVHGALMMYEPRFTAELLADLLSIQPSKTLLRRHLATRFKELLGRDVIQNKREAETASGYQPLTITAKIKTPKKSQFSLKRKKSLKNADELKELVCPMILGNEQSADNTTSSPINHSANTTDLTSQTTTPQPESSVNSTNPESPRFVRCSKSVP